MKRSRLHAVARRPVVFGLVVLAAMFGFIIPVSASHPEVSLAGSNFEIDTDANLRVDDASPSIDWVKRPGFRRGSDHWISTTSTASRLA